MFSENESSLKRMGAADFYTLLTEFSDACKASKFQKMDYKVWRNLFFFAKQNRGYVLFCYRRTANEIDVYCYNDEVSLLGHYTFVASDGFFAFLRNEFKQEDKDKMTTMSSGISVSTNTSNITCNDCYADNKTATNTVYNSYYPSYTGTSGITISTDDFCRKSECPLKNEKKEEKDMNFNFDFGQVDNNNIRMSPYGIAIKNRDGKWVSFNPQTQDVIDVECFNFNMKGLLWKMPVAVSAIAVGDTVIHNHKPMYVISVDDGIWVADIYEGERKSIMPLTNMFGFNFITKVVSIMDMSAFGMKDAKAPSAENPFGGNFIQMMMLGQMFGEDNGKSFLDGDMGKFMAMSMVMGGKNPFANMFGIGNQA